MSEQQQFDPSPILEDRALSDDERRLIDWLVEHGTGDAGYLRPQIERARVVSRCHCGCPTIDLTIGGVQHRASDESQRVADFVGYTPEGVRAGVLLWVTAGDLSCLEVYNLSDNLSEHEGSFALPVIDTLKPF